MKKIKYFLSALFGVSSTEFSGFRLLVITAFFCSAGLFIANYISFSPYNNYAQDSRTLDSLLIIMSGINKGSSTESIQYNLEVFDPNVASEQKLISYGFPPWLASRLIKYRSTGARFNKPNDLLKLYGFPEALFITIKDSVVIKKVRKRKVDNALVEKRKVQKQYKKTMKSMPLFDINLADTSVLKTIKGVGSKLSERIIKYRASLGGFISTSQLYQVYGLDSVVIKAINKNSVVAPDFMPTQININTATKEQLAAHPYITWTEAKLIVAYRNQHGSFKDTNDVTNVYSIDISWAKKNAPYLSF